MGSSAVLILTPGSFRSARIEYREVDLPEPVGPVTKINPNGRLAVSSLKPEYPGL